LKKLEDLVANLSNPGDGHGDGEGDGNESALVITEALNNEAAIFGDILKELEPTSPLIGFETMECDDSFVSNDPSPIQLGSSEMNNHSSRKTTFPVSSEKMAIVESDQQGGVDDPSFLSLPVLRQRVMGTQALLLVFYQSQLLSTD
jgi:hypothetical protein